MWVVILIFLITCLIFYIDSNNFELLLDEKYDGDLKRVINLTAECIVNLMTSSPKNCKVFKECGGAQVLYIILEYPSTRQYATGSIFCYVEKS